MLSSGCTGTRTGGHHQCSGPETPVPGLALRGPRAPCSQACSAGRQPEASPRGPVLRERPRGPDPHLVGSELHACLSLHQRGADLHDHGLDGVGAAPALGTGEEDGSGGFSEAPVGAGPARPGPRLTCLVRSSMQMAPPPSTYLQTRVRQAAAAGRSPAPRAPAPPPSHSPSGENGRHNPDKRRVEGEVILRTRRRRRQGETCPQACLPEARTAPGRAGAAKGSLTLKEKLRRMKSAPSFSLRIWRSLCKALSWSTLGSKERGLRRWAPPGSPDTALSPRPLPARTHLRSFTFQSYRLSFTSSTA